MYIFMSVMIIEDGWIEQRVVFKMMLSVIFSNVYYMSIFI